MKGLNIFLLIAFLFAMSSIQDIDGKKMSIDDVKKTIRGLRKTCSKKTDAPKELLDGQHRGEFPKDERLMCYIRCILSMTKTIKNGKVDWDFFLKNARLMMAEEYIPRVEHVVEVCQDRVTATDECEMAWQAGVCLYETDTIRGPVTDSSAVDTKYRRRSKRNFVQPQRHRLRHRSRRKADKTVCKNSRTKRHCRRV